MGAHRTAWGAQSTRHNLGLLRQSHINRLCDGRNKERGGKATSRLDCSM